MATAEAQSQGDADSVITPLLGLVDLGGPIIWLLLAMAVVALAIIALKCFQLAAFGVRDKKALAVAQAYWRDDQHQSALRVLDRVRHPLGIMLNLAMREANSREPALVREELQRLGEQSAVGLQWGLRPLELIAVTAPLVGLLGTVLGMIDAFRALEAAGSRVDPGVLSSGIWQALLTTAIGLMVAIPTTLAHGWLDQRAQAACRRIEDAVTSVFTQKLQRLVLPGHGAPSLGRAVEDNAVDMFSGSGSGKDVMPASDGNAPQVGQ